MTMTSRGTTSRGWGRPALVLLLVLGLVAAGCGRDDDEDSGGSASEAEAGEGTATPGEPEPVTGFDGTTIKLGALTPLTTLAATIGKPLTAGMNAYFAQLNAEGGVAGKYKVEVVTADTKYESPTAVQLYDDMKDDVAMFAQIFGTQIVTDLLPKLEADGIVAQPASLDSLWVREQYLLPIGAPYEIETINGLDYWLDNGGEGKRLCAVAADDAYGESALRGLEYAEEELGFEAGKVVRFSVDDTEFTPQINELKGDGCEAVLGAFTAVEISPMLTAASAQGFAPQWLGLAPSWLSIFAGGALKDYLIENYWVLSEGPGWGDTTDAPAMAELVEAREMYAADQNPDQYLLFGYGAARAVTAVLERAVERGDLSREGIVAAMNDIEVFEGGGLTGDYEWGPPEDRNPPRASTIFKINPDRPYGLEVVEQNYTSDAAESFEFE